MPDSRIQNLARTLVEYSVAIKPGDKVALNGDLPALPLIRETYKHVLKAGGLPSVQLTDEQMSNHMLRNASDDQLKWIAPLEAWAVQEADVLIFINARENTRSGQSVDPARNAIRAGARRDLSKTRFQRSAENTLRWTITQYPTNGYAQEADMSLEDFEDFVFRAVFADKADPVGEWKQLAARQQRYVDWLVGRKHIQVRGENIDMTLKIDGRSFINSAGTRNMPSGEIFTGPVEDSAEGWVKFTYPAIREGRSVEGIELRFKEGKVVEASARKNQDYLIAQLNSDSGARYLGEWAIGTNYGIDRFTGNILFDEKIGGTIHMAVGAGYPETGSKNESMIHWDMICDMRSGSEILIDGDLLYKNGEFVI